MPFTSPLLALVCGFERGGTTTVSELLRQAPGVEAGFEGGFLLAASPGDFPSVEPYFGMALRGWGLALEDMEYVCAAPGWEELYMRLAERFRPGEQVRVFDKTPRYMERLTEVMAKVPRVPAIVVVRDPRALFWSWLKRAEERPANWLNEYPRRYRSYASGYAAATEAGLDDRLLLVRHEDLSLRPEEESRRIFSFLGLGFDDAYLEFSPRFRNVRGDGITSAFVLEYREHLTEEDCARILEATSDLSAWWWEPPPGFSPPAPPPAKRRAGPVASRTDEERLLRRRTAAVDEGGPACFAGRVVGSGLRPLDAVLDLSWLPASGEETLAGIVERGRYRRVDWEARFRANRPGGALAGLDSHFDVVMAHSVLPFLDPGEAPALIADAASVLAPSGRVLLSAFLCGASRDRPVTQQPASVAPDGPPYQVDLAELQEWAAAVGLKVASDCDIGHPAGQQLVVLRRVSPRE